MADATPCANAEVGGRYTTQTPDGRSDDGESQVYVHYEDWDARQDQWVPVSWLLASSESRATAGQPHSANSSPVALGSKQRKRSAVPESGETQPSQRLKTEHQGSPSNNHNNWERLRGHGKGHNERSKVKNISRVRLGQFEVDCWYFSPYPEHLSDQRTLFVCQQCFKYTQSKRAFKKHQTECTMHEPPGRRIYSDPGRNLHVFEVDGAKQQLYGQNLCLFGKLFIEHKTLFFDPTPFFFYVLVEKHQEPVCANNQTQTRTVCRPVGYFSKEKESAEGFNLACILVLPQHQRKGYGRFIISLSYELSKLESKTGSPEKPLSDLGKLSYRSYWSCRILTVLNDKGGISIPDLKRETGIRGDDLVSTLDALNLLHVHRGQYVMVVSVPHVKDLLEPFIKRRFTDSFCKPGLLRWSPPVVSLTKND